MTPIKAIQSLMARDWSQDRIATAVGVRQSSISRILSGSLPKYVLGVALIKLAEKHKGK